MIKKTGIGIKYFVRIMFAVCGLALMIISCKSLQKTSSSTGKHKRPNILFIMADDHAYQAISAYNTSLIHTPNIDRIGKEGAVMDKGYVTNSVCSPSRAVILTGKYSHINGLKDNGTYFNGAQETLPKILQRNGYKTAMVGKWHLWSDPTGFDYWNILPAQGHYYNPAFKKMGKDTVYQGYITDVVTDMAVDWMDNNKDQSFCMFLYHKAPHRNWMPPLQYLDSFNKKGFPLPANFYDDYAARPALQRQHLTVANDFDIRYDTKIPCDTCPVDKINEWAPAEFQREMERLTPEERKAWDAEFSKEYAIYQSITHKDKLVKFQFRRYMEDYLRCITSVDDNVGRVLEYLQKSGLAENTIVVYTSDQGFFLGEHGLYDKRFMYEEAFRTPMLIRYPNSIPKGQHINEYTLNLDWAPTLLDFAGIDIPEDMQGESMKTLLETGKAAGWRKEIYYHYYERSFGATPHYGIRTPQYKLIHFYGPVDAWELYDLQKDPTEMKNLYNAPGYGSVIADLKDRLQKLQVKYRDDG